MTTSQNADILHNDSKENESSTRERSELQEQQLIHQSLGVIDVIARGWNIAHESD